ncbi:MAG: SDR family NAD(P)-dependent oxidoreductase [Gammaproteobacteria bacterium]|nr:SDR family NAD(P)-dependent oxidoreductase [Gammaproteobacteria bacterium]
MSDAGISDAGRKVALITGGGSGIGRASALRFATAGYRVAITDIDPAALADAEAQLVAAGGESLGFPADVADFGACGRVAADVLSIWGRLDALIANAGVQIGGSLLDADDADCDKILAVNLMGVANSCKAVLPAMQEQRSGAIVIVSSINALVGSVGMTLYDMSKAAVLALARSLATEFGTQGIRVNAVCPGNTITDFHINRMAKQGVSVDQIRAMTSGYGLLGRAAEPAEIANAIHFLASEEASFITGQTLVVDGGFSVTGRAQ